MNETKKNTGLKIVVAILAFALVGCFIWVNSEHYGTEIIIPRVTRRNQPTVERILDQMERVGIVHRNIG